ncbi:MAG: DUF4405 domain-containing protein [Planctomycetaceae bacterium]
MKRISLNLIVDLAAAILLLGMIATGYILRFPLPPGTNKSHSLWGVTRHGWGSLHFWISAALLGVLLVHVILHWHWLVSVVSKRFGQSISEKRSLHIGLIIGAMLTGVSVLFVWISYRNVEPINDAEFVGHSQTAASGEVNQLTTRANGNKAFSSRLSFSKDVSTIFERSCLGCHGPKRATGNFRVDRKQDFFAKANGGPLIVPGKSSESPLIAIVSGRRTDIPRPDRHRLPEADVTLLRTWIDAGAEWPAEEH